jgi:hypothetical protein
MNKNYILTGGKHKGRTIAWIEENDMSYLNWVKQNAAGLIKGANTPPPVVKRVLEDKDVPKSAIQPNLNFFNEGPVEISKPYILNKKEKNDE